MNSSFRRLNESGRPAVAPSLLSADFSRLSEEIRAVEDAGADFLHLDIMDGHFVPNITFGPMIVASICKIARVPLVTHLMISDPARYAEEFVRAGSDLISFHYEAMESGHEELVDRLHGYGCGAGIAINPDTPLKSVRGILSKADLLLTMTVFPGFGGQKLMPEVLGKIEEAVDLRRRLGYSYVIETDGGVNRDTAEGVRKAGSQILVAGTAVFGSGDYRSAIESIRGESGGS